MKAFTRLLPLAFLSAFCLHTQEIQAASLVTNGSFELADIDPGLGFSTLTSGSSEITGWTVVTSGIDYIGGYWQASNGGRSIDLDGNEGSIGGVSQTLATTPGTKYQVSFDIAGNPDGGNPKKLMRVSAAGQSGDFSFDTTGHTLTEMGWRGNTWIFVATSGSTTLTFQSLSSPDSAYGPALDNVIVTSVPIPSALFLFTPALLFIRRGFTNKQVR